MNALTIQRSAPTLPDMMRLADMLAQSTMVPKDYQRNPANCLVAIQWGSEIGLNPMQAMQNIAVINGRPSIWGDAAAALVKGHPAYEWMREGVSGEGEARAGWCEIKRRGHDVERREFSVAQAKRANLWGKAGPWQQYPDRMLQLRARGFAIRDVFPDALRGVITAEEAQDIPAEPATRVVGLAVPETPALASPQIHAMHAADDAPIPIYAPDGTLHQIGGGAGQPPVMRWMSAARKALAKLEDADAVRGWEEAMAPHMANLAESEPEAVEAVRNAARARLDALTPPDDDTQQETE